MSEPIRIPCHPAIGIHGWEFNITPDIARQIVAMANADQVRVSGCEDNLFSSRICQRGQKGCDIDHDAQPQPVNTRLFVGGVLAPIQPQPVADDAAVSAKTHAYAVRYAEKMSAERDQVLADLAALRADLADANDACREKQEIIEKFMGGERAADAEIERLKTELAAEREKSDRLKGVVRNCARTLQHNLSMWAIKDERMMMQSLEAAWAAVGRDYCEQPTHPSTEAALGKDKP